MKRGRQPCLARVLPRGALFAVAIGDVLDEADGGRQEAVVGSRLSWRGRLGFAVEPQGQERRDGGHQDQEHR